MHMKNLLHRVTAGLMTAAAIVGIFAVTGFPEPMWRQILIATGSAVAVQLYLVVVEARRRNGRT